MGETKSKVVLITGGSSGIGEATAIRLKKAGYVVYAAARRVERMAALKDLGIHVLSMDVTDEASTVAGVESILQAEGRVDVLVNNAGYGSYGALEDVPLAEARRQFDVNIFGLARVTQLVLPSMRQNRFGKIVNISSIGGKVSEPMGCWYHATKFALEGLSDCLRMEVKGFGIDVILIEPGGIKTEWNAIAVDNLLKVSGHTAYADIARMDANLLRMGDRMSSSPDGVAKVIEKAIRARRPSPRYAAGAGAVPALFMRKIAPDRLYDAVLMTYLRHAR